MAEAVSETATATAPALVGVWVHDPTDAGGTLRNFLFAEGREETVEPAEAELELVGRENAVIEYGTVTRVGLQLTVFVPFGDDWQAGVHWWKGAVLNRRTIIYRDNRGRLLYCAIRGGLSIADGRAGTALAVTLRRVDYDAEVA